MSKEFTYLIKLAKTYQNYLLIGIGAITLLAGSFYGYSYYKVSKEQASYRALVGAIEYFDAPIKRADTPEDEFGFLDKKEFKTHKEKWEKVASLFKTAYENHSGSGVAPLFLAYQSEALLQLGSLSEAISVLQLAISVMSNKDVTQYYQGKLALMLIDNEKAEQGVALLQKLALDDESAAHDMALYHLGNYYWHTKAFDKASNYWNQLVLKYGKDTSNPSPWMSVAKEKLRLIDSDVE